MRNKGPETKVISLKRKKLARKYKALFDIITRVKIFFIKRFKKPVTMRNYRKTINH